MVYTIVHIRGSRFTYLLLDTVDSIVHIRGSRFTYLLLDSIVHIIEAVVLQKICID